MIDFSRVKHFFMAFTALTLALTLSAQQAESIFDISTPRRVSVHDPSVVVAYSKNGKVTGEYSADAIKSYYIFGSHRAWARSTDLQNWTAFNNNISSSYNTIFAEDAAWSAKGGNQGNGTYNVSGNLWAPDVIWNKDMKKWCMYMSVNGDNWYSSIVLLTADSPTGNWTRVGPVVYSGFVNAAQARETDFYKVYSGNDFPSRYTLNRNGVHTYGTNAIDPCVFYDEDGNLWMTYGSWFGGLYMLRLDKATGLRDYTYTYATDNGTVLGAVSDVYQGLKIAGGNHCSGEASYIQYINDRYYLFVTYGGLTANGGYNMRVFSSKDVTGPYTDIYGHSAIYTGTNTGAGNTSGNVGSKVMAYYKLDLMGYGYIAQGHNSAIVDDDGKAYVVYHTRFTNGGEGHEVRVHQLFTTDQGGLVAAPFEYSGESLASSAYPTDKVVGTYKVIYHQITNYSALECQTEKTIYLNADGSVSGDYKGTWSQDADRPYLRLKLGAYSLEGVLLEQKMEGLNYTNLCFSAIGDRDTPMWGFKDVAPIVAEATQDVAQLPFYEGAAVARFATGNEFNNTPAAQTITEQTGLSLSFFVSGLDSDWNEIARSTDGQFTLFLSVLRYKGADFYEAAATPDPASPVKTDLWKAFLNGSYYATVSYNPDGTISYYRNGVLLFKYAANIAPNYGSGVTPASIVKAVIGYYRNNQLDFTRGVYNVVVAPSVPYALAGIDSPIIDTTDIDDYPLYNVMGQPVGPDYRGIVISRGRKCLRF